MVREGAPSLVMVREGAPSLVMVREGAPSMSLFGRTKDVDAGLRRHDGLDGGTSTPVGIISTVLCSDPSPFNGRRSPAIERSTRMLVGIQPCPGLTAETTNCRVGDRPYRRCLPRFARSAKFFLCGLSDSLSVSVLKFCNYPGTPLACPGSLQESGLWSSLRGFEDVLRYEPAHRLDSGDLPGQ